MRIPTATIRDALRNAGCTYALGPSFTIGGRYGEAIVRQFHVFGPEVHGHRYRSGGLVVMQFADETVTMWTTGTHDPEVIARQALERASLERSRALALGQADVPPWEDDPNQPDLPL